MANELQSARRGTTLNIIALGLVAALVVLIALLATSLNRALEERTAANDRILHTLEVLLTAERARAELNASDAGQLDARRHFQALRREADRLAALTSDNPYQVAETGRLRALLAGAGPPIGAEASGRIQASIANLRREELRLLNLRERARGSAYRASTRAFNRLIAAAAAMLMLSFAAALAALRGRERVRVQAQAHALLEGRVAERTAELAEANARLREEAEAREASEAKLRQAQKMDAVGQLTGGIAHDFNNMLAIIIGGLELARRRIGRGELDKANEYMANAEEGARRAATLTQRLLAFARRQPLQPEPIDMNALVAATSELLRRTIPAEVQLETVLAGGLWRAFADSGELENAIVNLALNGRDAMPEGGRLTIETANTHLDETYADEHLDVRAGQYVVLCVTDTGTGMPDDVADRAFDPFFTTKEQGKGTGLGLSQVFGFTKQTGGHAKIYTEEGVGTSVKLYIPRHHGPERDRARRVLAEDAPGARGTETVLLVEDEQRVRHLAGDALRELGYIVLTAADGAEALALLEGGARADLLLTDVVMPGINGRELATRAAALRPGMKILFMTGYTKNAIVHNGALDADVALITKPFGLRQLAAKVRSMLDGPGAG